MKYTVEVSHVGVVYSGDDFYDAMQAYEDSIEYYKGHGVTYLENDKPIRHRCANAGK